MNANVNRVIGAGLRARRNKLGLTQAQVARRMGKGQSYVSKIEQGERSLYIAEIFMYADALETRWQNLMADIYTWIGLDGANGCVKGQQGGRALAGLDSVIGEASVPFRSAQAGVMNSRSEQRVVVPAGGKTSATSLLQSEVQAAHSPSDGAA